MRLNPYRTEFQLIYLLIEWNLQKILGQEHFIRNAHKSFQRSQVITTYPNRQAVIRITHNSLQATGY